MKFQRAILLLAVAVTLTLSTAGNAGATPTWQAARNMALPGGITGLYNGNLSLLSCPATGDCAAAGIDQDAKGNAYGLLLNEVNGVWRDPTNITPPANADVSSGVSVFGLSCGGPGSCSAVGTYADTAQDQLSFVVNEVGGLWQRAIEVALPADAVKRGQVSDAHSVACASAGNCSAVGVYDVAVGATMVQEGFVLNEVANHWSSAREVILPAATNFNPFAALNQIACASAGNCSAVGSYIDKNNVTHGLVVNEVGGTWRAGTSLALPANASQYAGASLSEVDCASAGNCAAAGTYNVSGGAVEMLVDNEARTTWARANEVQLPANAASNPDVLLYGFRGVACPTAGNCASGGQYQDKNGGFQGFLVNEVNDHWQSATQLALPAGAEQAGENGGVVAVSCPSAGDCTAGAAYLDSSGAYQALVVSETNRSWSAGTKITLPAGSSTVGQAGGVYAVDCQKTGVCDAVGSYETASGNYLGFSDHTP
jgi:hypothetical protein